MGIRPLPTEPLRSLVVASVDEVPFELYCALIDPDNSRITASDLKLPAGLTKLFSQIRIFLSDLSTQFKVGIKDVVRAFQQHDMFQLLKGVGFNLKLMLKALQAFTSLIPKSLFSTFQVLVKTHAFQRLREGTLKVDQLLTEHPILKRLAGVALAGFLLWIWLSMSFTGNPDFDLDVSSIILAFKGSYSITDLFLSPEGLTMLSLLGTGMFTGLGVSWLGTAAYNLMLALLYTGAKKANDSGLATKIQKALPFKRLY